MSGVTLGVLYFEEVPTFAKHLFIFKAQKLLLTTKGVIHERPITRQTANLRICKYNAITLIGNKLICF